MFETGVYLFIFCQVLLKKIIYFNWRLITLQYCGSFCHKLTCISHGCTRVRLFQIPLPPPSPSHPSGLSQCTGFECPVSPMELGLVIYFTYGNTCFNAIVSNHLTLAFFQSPKLCFLYLCLSCYLAYKVVVTMVLNSIYMR